MSMANTIMGSAMAGLLWTFIIGGGLLILLIVFLNAQFKHRVTVRQITNKGHRVFHVRAKEIFEKGNKYWKLTKKSGLKFPLMPMPPADAMDVDEKGNLSVVAYLLSSGEWSFQKDRWHVGDIPEEILELKASNPEQYKAMVKQWRKENYVVSEEPITNTARSELMNQLEKAEDYKRNNVHQLVRDAMPYIFVVMILLLVLVFWGELIKPAAEVSSKTESIMDKQLEIIEKQTKITEDLKQLIKREQVIEGKDIIKETNINDDNNS